MWIFPTSGTVTVIFPCNHIFIEAEKTVGGKELERQLMMVAVAELIEVGN